LKEELWRKQEGFDLREVGEIVESRCNDVERLNILAKLSNTCFRWTKRYRTVFEDRKNWNSVVASWGVAVGSNQKRHS
jgi:hypothetical protein